MKKIFALAVAFILLCCVVIPIAPGYQGAAAEDASAFTPAPATQVPAGEPASTETPETQAPAGEPAPSETPETQAPAGEPAPTQTPETQAPTGEPAPTETPETQAPTEEPSPTETPETQAPAEEPSPTEAVSSLEPVQEPTPAPSAAPTGPAWVQDGESRRYGELEDLIEAALGTIYIRSDKVLELEGYTLDQLKSVKFAPDREIFPDGEQLVILSILNPDGKSKDGVLFLWVGREKDVPQPETILDQVTVAPDDQVLEMEILVGAQGYAPGEACLPVFSLSSTPQISDGQGYAVSIDGGEYQRLPGASFAPDASGAYRFAVLDELGGVLARSSKYQVTLPAPTAEPPAEPPAEGSPDSQVSDLLSLNALPLTISDPVDLEITVTAVDYYPGEVSDIAPLFTLSGLPQEAGFCYGVMVNEGPPTALSGSVYTAAQAGVYTLRFVILDAAGQVAARSAKYELNLDFSTESAIKKQAWALGGDGARVYGTLEGLLSMGAQTIYIQTSETIVLSSGAAALSGVTLLPDPGVYATGSCQVVVSNQNPVDVSQSQGRLFVWVEALQGGSSPAEAELMASYDAFVPGVWQNTSPTFTLTLIPDTLQGVYFAVIPGGGTPVRLSGGTYTALDEGRYSLTFAVVDGSGAILAKSASFEVALDTTPPTLRVSAQGLTLTVTAFDAGSGISGVSLDGGASWQAMEPQTDGSYTFTYTAESPMELSPGAVQVKDPAGNTAAYQSGLSLSPSREEGQGPSGFGGASRPSGYGGTASRTVSHASASASSVTAYNGVDLIIEDGAMTGLTLGGEELGLCLTRGEDASSFTAQLAKWNGELNDSSQADTLILSAVTDNSSGEDGAYLWAFNGMVYKKLAASGIDYLVLKVDDQLTAISTAGFTAGVRYTLLRAAGLASKAFDYQVKMTPPDYQMEMRVAVEGETYAIGSDPNGEMFYYDVYTGPASMMNAAFGAYGAGQEEEFSIE